LGNDLIRATTFSSNKPGTSQSSRFGSSCRKASRGTVIVVPSRGVPGSKWYSSGNVI